MAAFLLLGTLVLKVISSEKEIRCSDKSSTKLDYKILENRVAKSASVAGLDISSVDTIAEQ